MSLGYFHRVTKETSTRFWINNPIGEEVEKAISSGAINCTTNPSYCSRLIKNESEYICSVIDDVIKEVKDDNIVADIVYQKSAYRIMNRFLPVYEQSKGTQGYVTIQGDPRLDEDVDVIVNSALRYQKLGKNFMAKIPVTEAGCQAIEELIPMDIPVCATEVFSISQTIYVCELYQRVARKCGKYPLFYVTHITGIFDEYLQNIVKQEGIEIASNILHQSGCIVARKEYKILKERGYKTTMLGGGARGIQHFTEFVGGDVHITINWDTAQSLIEKDELVVSCIDVQTSEDVIDELSRKLPDFRKAFYEDELSLEEFKDYGPVMYFRNMFLTGWNHLLKEIAIRRVQLKICH